jgi:hypothetical protein
MSIEVEQENIEELKLWGMGLHLVQEQCYFCGQPTRTWHLLSNTPVCTDCAGTHNRDDITRVDIVRAPVTLL